MDNKDNSAIDNFNQYIKAPLSEKIKTGLINNKEHLLETDSFKQTLSFGTGGVREIVDHGTGRLNIYNIGRLSLSLFNALKEKPVSSILTIIAYDSRNSSVEFSRIAYHLLTQAGANVKVFKNPVPTPVLSFAVRELKAEAGIVITASHNPPEYNGFKVYGPDGGQIVSPVDKNVMKHYNAITYQELPANIESLSSLPVPAEDQIEEAIFEKFTENLKKEYFVSEHSKNVSVLYSPLHGTGASIFKKVFGSTGFSNFNLLEPQAEPDGDFPLVKSPNPEDPEAFEMLIEHGKKTGAELLLASDPDADRIGAAIKEGDSYRLLNGNQTGALLLEYILSIRAKLQIDSKSPYICTTIVTSPLIKKIAEHHNIAIRETLTGFKYIAAAISEDESNYIYGGEESYGYLLVNWIRDKDSISSAVALAELADTGSLSEKLNSIYLRYGVFNDRLFSVKNQPGSHGEKNIQRIMDQPGILVPLIEKYRKVDDILDLTEKGKQPKTDALKNLKNTLERSSVIQYYLLPEGRITIRPSGTEPKVKFYINLGAGKKDNQGENVNIEKTQKELAAESELFQNEIIDFLQKKPGS